MDRLSGPLAQCKPGLIGRKRRGLNALALVALLTLLPSLSAQAPSSDAGSGETIAQTVSSLETLRGLESKLEATAQRVQSSVVALQISGRSGSGTVISEDGWIATAGHVSGQNPGTNCRIILSDGRLLVGKSYGFFQDLDYGLIRADGELLPNGSIGDLPELSVATIGDSNLVGRGEWVLAMGHPLGYEKGRPPVVRVGRITNPENRGGMIVIDAPLISGDSGGPVFDVQGQLIGINQSVSINDARVNNATPISGFKTLLPDLKRNRVYGEGEGTDMRGEIVRTLSEEAFEEHRQALKLLAQGKESEAMLKIESLAKMESPLPHVLFDAGRISARLAISHWRARERQPGREAADAAMDYLRQAVDVGWRDVSQMRQHRDLRALRNRRDFRRLARTLRELAYTPTLAIQVETNNEQQVIVSEVQRNSAAKAAGFRAGDVLVALDGVETPDVLAWANALAKLDLSDQVLVQVERDGTLVSLTYDANPASRKNEPKRRQPQATVEKFDRELLSAWDEVADDLAPAVFEVQQRRNKDRVAFATAVSKDGYLITKASRLLNGPIWVEDDDGERFEASVIELDQVTDIALLKIEHELSSIVDFSGTQGSAASANDDNAAPSIAMQLAAFVASVDDQGDALTWGAVSVVAYDSDISREVDPRGPFMGIRIDTARTDPGARVTNVTSDSPAEKAGLREDDVIYQINLEDVADASSLIAIIRRQSVGDTVPMLIEREGEKLELEITFAARADVEGGDPYIGVGVGQTRAGVQINDVVSHRSADRAGIWVGDVLLKANGEEVTDVEGFVELVKSSQPMDQLTLVVERDGEEITFIVEVGDERERPNSASEDNRTRMKGPSNLRRTRLGDVIQHDGLLDPADVGAPLIDTQGRVVGLNMARSDRTRSFAMPASRVQTLVTNWLTELENVD